MCFDGQNLCFEFQQDQYQLVGGLEHLDYFSILHGMSSFPLTFIFFKMVKNHQPAYHLFIYIISSNGSILPANNYLLVPYVCHCCPAEGSSSGITFPWRIHGAGILMLTWLGYIDGIHGTPYIAAPLGSCGILFPLGVVGFIPQYLEFVHARTGEDTTLSTL